MPSTPRLVRAPVWGGGEEEEQEGWAQCGKGGIGTSRVVHAKRQAQPGPQTFAWREDGRPHWLAGMLARASNGRWTLAR